MLSFRVVKCNQQHNYGVYIGASHIVLYQFMHSPMSLNVLEELSHQKTQRPISQWWSGTMSCRASQLK